MIKYVCRQNEERLIFLPIAKWKFSTSDFFSSRQRTKIGIYFCKNWPEHHPVFSMILFLLFGGIVLAGNFFHGGVAQYSQPYGSSSSSDQGGVYASGYSANSGTSGQYNSASYSPTATGQYSAYSSYNSPPSSSSSYSSNSGTYQPSGSLYSTSGQTSQYGQ